MEKLRESSILKVLCYILIPILAAILFLSIVHISYLNEYQRDGNTQTEYKQSQWFAYKYFYAVLDKVGKAERSEETGQYIQLEDSKGQKYYYSEDYYSDSEICINYIIIDKETGNMYTNIKSQDYKKEKELYGRLHTPHRKTIRKKAGTFLQPFRRMRRMQMAAAAV